MTEIAVPATRLAVGTAATSSAIKRFGKWLGSDRIFPRIPFLMVELLFILVIFVPFLLTIYISVLKFCLPCGVRRMRWNKIGSEMPSSPSA